jgi:hypothetical protein
MPLNLSMKRFIFIIAIIAAVCFLGCTAIGQKDDPEDKPPEGLKLSSILYELAIDPDPENFAYKHNIFFHKNRVKVFIYFDPASSDSDREKIIEKYKLIVEKKSNDLLRALVSVNILIPLSRESVIWSIKLPDKPIP